jgi:hypothetical protein
MILEYSIDMIHAVSATILQKAELTFSAMLTESLKAKTQDYGFKKDKMWMEGKFSIQDDPTRPGQKIYLGEDGFVGNVVRIMTKRYAFKTDKLLGEEVMLDDMRVSIFQEILKLDNISLRMSPVNVRLQVAKDDIFIHAELFVAQELQEAVKEESK